MKQDEKTRFFFELTPDRVLASVEASGLKCTGRCIALNSFENRVYDTELDSESPSPKRPKLAGERVDHRVVKFYRPGRWRQEQIAEEHEFLSDLQGAEIPAIAPEAFSAGETLRATEEGIWYAVFPKVGGRAPEELNDEQLVRLGRLLGRIHNVGASKAAPHRVQLTPESYGTADLEYLLRENWLPLDFAARYRAAVEAIVQRVTPWFRSVPVFRIHGDCHLGNLLWNDAGPFFLDFDDMVTGPAVQDVWMLVPGRDSEAQRQRAVLLQGYREMRLFDDSTLSLIEPLRALRYIHYTAWLARRWEDPAFPSAFPEFNTHRYWSDETLDLEEQLRLIQGLPRS